MEKQFFLQRNHKGEDSMRATNFCLSVSKRNEDVLDLVDEYSDMFGLSKADTIFTILREYPRLKMKERVREIESIRTGGYANAV